jgi:hypothetical protein
MASHAARSEAKAYFKLVKPRFLGLERLDSKSLVLRNSGLFEANFPANKT